MAKDTKPIVSYEDSFDKLNVQVGRVVKVELESSTHKPTYKMEVDFWKIQEKSQPWSLYKAPN